MDYDNWGWRPYVSVAERRSTAAREMEKRKKKGHTVSPVFVKGRKIATTFWGKAWCENLERYSDYASRLPRGRTYVRNGSVLDLQITTGSIQACVSGSDLYTVELKIAPVKKAHWKSICDDCAGTIDSMIELLKGQLSKSVMDRICRPTAGLFPSPGEIELSCSCPDWASMCKHVAAVLYGIGARFDHQPELLFRLRGVDEKELIAEAGKGMPLVGPAPASGRVLDGTDLSDLFDLDMAVNVVPESPDVARKKKAAAAAKTRREIAKRTVAKKRAGAPKRKG